MKSKKLKRFTFPVVLLVALVSAQAYAIDRSGGTRGGAAKFDPNLRAEFEKAQTATLTDLTNHTPQSPKDSLKANWSCFKLTQLNGNTFYDQKGFDHGWVAKYFVDYDTGELIGIPDLDMSLAAVVRIGTEGKPIVEYSWGFRNKKKEMAKGAVPSVVYPGMKAIRYEKCNPDE
jgi:hypothetical protein